MEGQERIDPEQWYRPDLGDGPDPDIMPDAEQGPQLGPVEDVVRLTWPGGGQALVSAQSVSDEELNAAVVIEWFKAVEWVDRGASWSLLGTNEQGARVTLNYLDMGAGEGEVVDEHQQAMWEQDDEIAAAQEWVGDAVRVTWLDGREMLRTGRSDVTAAEAQGASRIERFTDAVWMPRGDQRLGDIEAVNERGPRERLQSHEAPETPTLWTRLQDLIERATERVMGRDQGRGMDY